MKKIFLILLLISYSVFAQTPLPIFSPNFSSAGGWQINGNASVISSSYLRLTPNAGNQAGSAFWKQKISLPDDMSFSTYFTSKMIPGSRADGMTFCIQQASNNAGSSGGGLGYQGMPGKSIAVEYDTYDNGEVGGNNHIALDINGVLHSGSTNVVASPVNLADGAMKYNWIEYNGVTHILEVRISNTTTRPTAATLSVSINLATNFVGISDFYFGYTAATGGATEEHDVYSALVAPNSTPLSSTGNYSQGVASIVLTSSNSISCTALTSTITVTTKDVNGVGMPTNLVMSSDVGGGTLSAYTLTTNSSGIGTVVFTSNSGTLASNTIRAEEPNVGAYGTVIVTKTGIVPVGGSVSSATHNSNTNSGTLTLTGYSGTISKWQKSVDGNIWTDIINTAATYSYTNQSDGTQFRAVISGGTCTANSTSGTVSVSFSYTVNVYNSDNVGLLNIPVSLYGKLKASSVYTLISTVYTNPLGAALLSSTNGTSMYDFKIIIENLVVPNPTVSDANTLVNKVLTQSFNSKDYYKFDTNNSNTLNISDAFLVFYKISGGITSWAYMMPSYRIFNETEWTSINTSTSNLKGTYPGTQTISMTNLPGGGTANFYLIRTGLKQ